MIYHVTQHPKKRGMVSCNIFVEAKSSADAIRKAIEAGASSRLETWFGPDPDYYKPTAKPLELGKVFAT